MKYGRKESVQRAVERLYDFLQDIDRLEAIGPGRESVYKKARQELEDRREVLRGYAKVFGTWQRSDPRRFDFLGKGDLEKIVGALDQFLGSIDKRSFHEKWGRFYDQFPTIMNISLRKRRSEDLGLDSEDEDEPSHLPKGFFEVGLGRDFPCGKKLFREVWERAAPKTKFSGEEDSAVHLRDIWTEFEAVHRAGNVLSSDKIRAFRLCFSGAAKEFTDSFQGEENETSYMKMVKATFDTFGIKSMEIQSLQRKLMANAPASESYEDLKTYIIQTDVTVRSLGNINGDPEGAMRTVWPRIISFVPQSLWTEIRALVEEFAKYRKSLPEQFFLKRPLQLFQAVKEHILQNYRVFAHLKEAEPDIQFAATAVRVQQKPALRAKAPRPTGKSAKRPADRGFHCFICNDPGHRYMQCSIPKATRVQYVLEKGICPGCLGTGHVLADCEKRNLCRKCSRGASDPLVLFHHFALCPQGANPAKKPKIRRLAKTLLATLAAAASDDSSDTDEEHQD